MLQWLTRRLLPTPTPDPKPGETWMRDTIAASPWPDDTETTLILDVQDGYVKHRPHGLRSHCVNTMEHMKTRYMRVKP